MAVWWVFQNQSYERSRDGGYIWAPLVDKAGHKKSLDTEDKIDVGQKFEPEHQTQIYQPQINNIIDSGILKSIKTALWAIAIILLGIWWSGKK